MKRKTRAVTGFGACLVRPILRRFENPGAANRTAPRPTEGVWLKKVGVLCDVFVMSNEVGMVGVAKVAMPLREMLVAHPFGSGLIGVHNNCTVVKNCEHRAHDQSSSEAR